MGSGLASDQAPGLRESPDFSAPGLKTQNNSLRGDSSVITETAPLQRPVPRYIWVTALLVLLSAVGVGWWLVRLGTRTAEVALAAVPLTSYPGKEREPSFFA